MEIKITHTGLAWWSLTHLYQPVLQKIFPLWSLNRLEVFRIFDPYAASPEVHTYVQDPAELPIGAFGIMPLRSDVANEWVRA